jgi:pilus assembly protein TadC
MIKMDENSFIIQKIKSFFPDLGSRMLMAGMKESQEEFINKTVVSSLNMWLMFLAIPILFIFNKSFADIRITLIIITIIGAPLSLLGIFFFFMQLPDVKKLGRDKEINKEIVFAGRFLVIEIESGVPLYNAMLNLAKAYPNIGVYFAEIITKVDLGTSMEEALNESIMYSPSKNLQRLLWQILNSISTGSQVNRALDSVIEQIVREQIIEVKAYSKKLNPLAMFYMMIAVILPTLGIAMASVAANFMGFMIDPIILFIVWAMIAFIQFMFINIIGSQRPAMDI